MPLLHFDGFDHYSALTDVTFLRKFQINNTVTLNTGSQGRYSSGNTLLVNSSTENFGINMAYYKRDMIFGFGYFSSATASNTSDILFMQNNAQTVTQMKIQKNAAGYVSILDHLNNIVYVGAQPLSHGVWHYLEIRIKIHHNEGLIHIKNYGVDFLKIENINTAWITEDIERVMHGNSVNTNGDQYDDYYVVDNEDAYGFLGEVRCLLLTPTADTAQKQFTANAGGTNYTQIDEYSNDGNTTYVQTSTVGHRDLYTMSDITITPQSIPAIEPFAAFYNVGYPTKLRPVIKSSATVHNTLYPTRAEAGYAGLLSLTYDYKILQDPSSLSAWTLGGVNALEAGFETVMYTPDYFQWDPARKSTAITLSNTNKNATNTTSTDYHYVKSMNSKNMSNYGKWFAEFTFTDTTNDISVGISDDANILTPSITTYLGNFRNSIGYNYNGQISSSLFTGNTVTTHATYTVSDVIGILVNCRDYNVKFYKNGTLIQTVAVPAGLTGVRLSATIARTAGSPTVILNTGDVAFSFPPAETYQAWG